MLFKPYHIPMIRSGSKTVTRRDWADGYARPNVGSVQIAAYDREDLDKSPMFTTDEEADCYIRVLEVFDQALGDMTDADARKEGDYESLEEFREGWEKINGAGSWDPDQEVAVVEFGYVGRERPEE